VTASAGYSGTASVDAKLQFDSANDKADAFSEASEEQRIYSAGKSPPASVEEGNPGEVATNVAKQWMSTLIDTPQPMHLRLEPLYKMEALKSHLKAKNRTIIVQNIKQALDDYCAALKHEGLVPSCRAPVEEHTIPPEHRYVYVMKKKSHADALAHCKTLGLVLVSLDSEREDKFLWGKILNELHGFEWNNWPNGLGWWTGGVRVGNSNEWKWGESGDTWSATPESSEDRRWRNWGNLEPNNNGGKENCIELSDKWGSPWSGFWNDEDCNQKKSFICDVDDQ